MTLTADSKIEEILTERPETAEVFQSFGMNCLGYAIANNESIRQAATRKGVDLAELAKALGIST